LDDRATQTASSWTLSLSPYANLYALSLLNRSDLYHVQALQYIG